MDHRLKWWFLLFFPLTFLCAASTSELRSFHWASRIYRQISELYQNHPHWRFTPITIAEYLEALYQNSLTPADQGVGKQEQKFARSMLTSSEYYGGNHLRLVVIETQDDTEVGVLATFATMERAWVFLDSPPSAMQGFEHFKVLHEVVHTDTAGMILGYLTKGNLTHFLLTLPLMVLMVKWELTSFIGVTLYWLVFLSITKFTFKWFRQRMRFLEEVYADDFALGRCPRHWFDGFSERDIMDFANAVCGTWLPAGTQQHGSTIYDAPLTEQQVKWRRIELINRLNRMLKRDEYLAEGTIRMLPLKLIEYLNLSQHIVLAVIVFILGFQYANLTAPRLIVLAMLMILTTIAGLVVSKTSHALAAYWDANLNAKPISERTAAEQESLTMFNRGLKWREQFDDRWYRMRDRGLDNDRLAVGTTGRLFMPKEVNLYFDFESPTSFIYHDKSIDYDISHLEYDAGSHSLVVVMNNQVRLDLGVKVRSRIRPLFLKNDAVQIIRTENGEVIEGITVPLSKDGSKH